MTKKFPSGHLECVLLRRRKLYFGNLKRRLYKIRHVLYSTRTSLGFQWILSLKSSLLFQASALDSPSYRWWKLSSLSSSPGWTFCNGCSADGSTSRKQQNLNDSNFWPNKCKKSPSWSTTVASSSELIKGFCLVWIFQWIKPTQLYVTVLYIFYFLADEVLSVFCMQNSVSLPYSVHANSKRVETNFLY